MALHICEDIQQAKIIISDNGKGIAPDKLPHIFERMYQCDQSRSAKGNGLGLAIAKELISVHKGTITAENSSDKGTVFTNIASQSPVNNAGLSCYKTRKKQGFGKVMARFAFYNWNHERRKPYDDYYN